MTKDEAIKIALDALQLWHWTGESINLMKAHDALRDVYQVSDEITLREFNKLLTDDPHYYSWLKDKYERR